MLDRGADVSGYGNSETVLTIMAQFRQNMESSERDDRTAVLCALYSAHKVFPREPPINHLEIKKLQEEAVGSGGFGSCWKGMFLERRRVAMKSLHEDIQDPKVKRRLDREVKTWRDLRHPHVLEFIGLCEIGLATFLVSPWMEHGTATQYLRNGHSERQDCQKLLLQVLTGIQYLHSLEPPVVHGDLKGPNILVSGSGDAVIADFGLSEVMSEASGLENSSSFYKAGSRRWQAPELVNVDSPRDARRTKASDMFAFGRVMIEVYTLVVPFAGSTDGDVNLKAAAGQLPLRPTGQEVRARGLNDRMWKLTKKCCRYEPARRPSADEVIARWQDAVDADVNTGFRASAHHYLRVVLRSLSLRKLV
ncbi:hypothetical protein BOTBODRAFT_33287 [Botryobasidium botryosum FD-172 SS1]|uniref:Protein kinase domain-containing protein n=1 Tax=Botryobasidium botryosum (strain FD-172 SS1) TaxID=930990 RepID=A0A067MGQ2_BOTB1|nr:hypothetical protein BOTBODRAFT_33287 [Botryobasidium botryosum FD-172 SS1]